MELRSSTLRKETRVLVTFVCSLLMTAACESHSAGSEKQMMLALDSFTVSYYNWQYHRAQRFCTPESEPWLKFAASQVTQEDVELLRKETEATYEVRSIEFINDSSALANITVFDFLQPDSIGQPPHHVDKADFTLRIVLPASEKKWKIELTQLPRPEKNKP